MEKNLKGNSDRPGSSSASNIRAESRGSNRRTQPSAVSSVTDVPRQNSVATTSTALKKVVDNPPLKEESYDDEGFEDYNDEDFEEEEKPSNIAPAKQSVAAAVAIEKRESNSNQLSYIEAKRLKDEAKRQQGGGGGAGPLAVPTLGTLPAGSSAGKSSPGSHAEALSASAASGNMTARSKKMVSLLPDPRFFRVQKIRDSNVMDLAVDKSTQLNILPRSRYELYQSQLRQTPEPPIKQVGVPMSAEKRDMEVNTTEAVQVDKEMQFCHGDDTAFFNILRDVQRRRDGHAPAPVSVSVSVAAGPDGDSFESNVRGAAKLTAFLNRACFVFENSLPAAADGERAEASSSSSSSSSSSKESAVFSRAHDWISLGGDKASGANELLSSRAARSVRFSGLDPSLLVATYPYPPPQDDSDMDVDLKPFKGLYVIWDLSSPGGPAFVLEASGQPTCACFSGSQPHIVVAGTMEGSIHLWDLRESSFIHTDKDAVDLRISKGIRKPSYSTHVTASQISAALHHSHSHGQGQGPEDDVEQHVAPIAQIEPLDADGVADDKSFGGVSQFVSIDDSGVIMFWVTSSSSSSAQDLPDGSAAPSSSSSTSHGHHSGAADLGRSPWSKVCLLQTRRLVVASIPRSMAPNTNTSITSPPSSSSSSYSQRSKQDSVRLVPAAAGGGGGGGLQAPRAVLATLPQDLSTLLVAAPEGSVLKLARFGTAAHPHALKRDERTQYLQSSSSSSSSGGGGGDEERKSMGGGGGPGAKEVKYFTAVSAMGVRNCCYRGRPVPVPEDAKEASSSSLSQSFALVLVGRTDGTVDLFRSDCEGPLQSWSLSASSSSSVVLLRWIPHRPAAFLAADSAGRLFLFDLLQDAGCPVGSEQLSTETKLSSQMLDTSGGRHTGTSSSSSYRREALPLHIAVASGGATGPFVRRLSRPARTSRGGTGEAAEEQEQERLLVDAVSSFSSKTAMEQFVTTLPRDRDRDRHLK